MTDRYFVDDRDLLRAIGSVAVESAILDEFLRNWIIRLVSSDEIWLLVEGQPTEWLCQTSRLLLAENDPYQRGYTEEQHARFNDLISSVGPLRTLRNAVVHGTWKRKPSIGTEPGEIDDRPWGGPKDGAYICSRSRLRKIFHEQYYTVSDVDQLAEKIRTACQDLVNLSRAMQDTKYPDWSRKYGRAFPRWPAEQPADTNE